MCLAFMCHSLSLPLICRCGHIAGDRVHLSARPGPHGASKSGSSARRQRTGSRSAVRHASCLITRRGVPVLTSCHSCVLFIIRSCSDSRPYPTDLRSVLLGCRDVRGGRRGGSASCEEAGQGWQERARSATAGIGGRRRRGTASIPFHSLHLVPHRLRRRAPEQDVPSDFRPQRAQPPPVEEDTKNAVQKMVRSPTAHVPCIRRTAWRTPRCQVSPFVTSGPPSPPLLPAVRGD